jgi:hypothetical protein
MLCPFPAGIQMRTEKKEKREWPKMQHNCNMPCAL